MAATIDGIIQRVSGYWPRVDKELLLGAYEFAGKAHQGQERLSGTPYISHPLEVGGILAEIESDEFAIAAGFLHDTIEDTDTSLEDIEEAFGESVAQLVDGVTKLRKLDFASRQEEQARNLRKMFLAMAQDVRVILIKLADRLHNMRTLSYLPPANRIRTAEETLHIFTPICHRLGVHRLRAELEDLALRHLEPEEYRDIVRKIGLRRDERRQVIETAREQIEAHLRDAGIEATVQGRAKHIYSIYQKMKTQDIDFSQIQDLNALRVIVNEVSECYAVLGIAHDLWVPIPDTFTDHIAMPKSNNYRSLHTKVLGPDHSPMELQIRTTDMHRSAEYGVASHWRYKEGDTDARLDQQVAWIRQLLELETDLSESHEFLELLQVDLFKDQVFVFTPDGDVIDLPAGAGPLDFAYRVHTEVGHQCVGAVVNGEQVGLDYELNNGDIVRIITSSGGEPRHDWLRLVQSSHAKSKVRHFLREKSKQENVAVGSERLQRAMARLTAAQRETVAGADKDDLARHFDYHDKDGLLAAIGYGAVEAQTVIDHILERDAKPDSLVEEAHMLLPVGLPSEQRSSRQAALPVSAGGVDGFHSRISKCCNPLPGDDIRGYITRGSGLTIHRADCKNLAYHAQREPERIVELTWSDDDRSASFRQDIEVIAVDRLGLLSHITAIISDADINIATASAEKTAPHLARLQLTLEISRRRDLEHVIERIHQLIDVVEVRRLGTDPTAAT